MMLYDALEEILPFHDCAKLYICIANAMKSVPTLWAQNTDFLT